MNLLRFFKREKAAEAVGETAVLNYPIVAKPASERFGKTVMPNAARVMEPMNNPLAPSAPKPFSFGESFVPKAAPSVAPGAERTIALPLSDVLPQVPADLVQAVEMDPEERLVFKAADLERGMANGRPAVSLRSVYQQMPTLFVSEIAENDEREIGLPFQKVLEQFASFHVRVDQVPDDAVPEVETPFLKVTMEDSKKFGTPVRAARPAATPVASAAIASPAPSPAPAAAPCSRLPVGDAGIDVVRQTDANVVRPTDTHTHASHSEAATSTPSPAPKVVPRAPIRLSLPTEPTPAPVMAVPASVAAPAPAAAPALPKIFPHGAGVPIPERVPASSGSPAPISLPSPLAQPPAPKSAPAPTIASAPKLAPAAPIRIPFKVTPPASDLCPPPPLPLRAAAASDTPLPFSAEGPRVQISLVSVLRGIPPFQLTGPIDHVPAAAVIELPFAIVQPQLALGRVAISPAQFHAAMPEEYRALYQLDEGGVPVSLPLPEILQHLPNESIQLRMDQEEVEVANIFETPFSQKAAEDAARMKTPVGPIAKPASSNVAAGGVDRDEGASATASRVAAPTKPGSPAPETISLDEPLDAKGTVAQISRLPGVKACAVVFSDGLSLAGNIPDVYETDALCAMAPEIMKRMGNQMNGVNLGELQSVTLFCEKAPVSFFTHQNICLAVLHATNSLTDEVRARLGRSTQELAQMYAQPAALA